MSIYTNEEIRKLQLVELEMLRKFDDICQANQINYFVLFGTGIGAVRHKGFIPWDDDVDIGMLRKDYEKLKSIFDNKSESLILISPDDDYEWHDKIFPRLYLPGTVFETESWKEQFINSNEKFSRPIWIDIFLFDYCNEDEIDKKIRQTKKYKWMYIYSKYKSRFRTDRGVKGIIDSIIKRMFFDISHLIPNMQKKIYKKYLDKVTHNPCDTIISYDSWEDHDIRASFCPLNKVFPTTRIDFENITVSIQADYDYILTNMYGNYMELPPEEKRYAHRPFLLKL